MGPDDEFDDNGIAAYAEGRLSGARRARMEAHLAANPEARALVAALVLDRDADEGFRTEESPAPPPAAPRAVPTRAPWLPFALAATVLVGIGVALLERPRTASGPAASGPTEEARLEALAADLEARRPDLFRGFRPVDVAALPGRGASEMRGGLLVTAPRERTLGGRPEVDWRTVPGATGYEVTVTRGDGSTVLSRRAGAPPFAWPADAPPLEPGAYVVGVAGDAAFGRAEGRRTFSVASAEEARTLSEAEGVIAAVAPPDLAALLAAHDALRRGYPEEALRRARAHLAARPDDPAGKALLQALLAARGAR